MLRKKPLIGVLAARMQSDLDILDKVAITYTSAVYEAGGIPIILTNMSELMGDYTSLIDGLIIIGGNSDVDPSLYGETNEASNDVDPQKDRMELNLIENCIDKLIPILGVCRGMQTLNVYFGGTLIQNVPTDKINHLQYPKQDQLVHDISVNGSKFIKEGIYKVNSIHHQAVSKVGENLRVTALSPDGVVEMFEHEKLPILGVQWHPECIPQEELSVEIFDWLIKEANRIS